MPTESSSTQNQQSRSDTSSSVDLKHPPSSIQNLPDSTKRFLVGMIREGYADGLEGCSSGRLKSTSKRDSFKYADQWIASQVPFLSDVIND